MIKKFTTLSVPIETAQQLDQIHKAMKMKVAKSEILAKIMEGIYDAASNFLTKGELDFIVDVSGRTCQIVFYGKPAVLLAVGASEEECKEVVEGEFNKERAEEEQPKEKLKEDKWSEEK